MMACYMCKQTQSYQGSATTKHIELTSTRSGCSALTKGSAIKGSCYQGLRYQILCYQGLCYQYQASATKG